MTQSKNSRAEHSPEQPEARGIDGKVVRLIEAGAPVGDAVRIALALSPKREDVRRAIPTFAERHQLPPTAVSTEIYGGRPPSRRLLAALIEELGGSAEEWKHLLTPVREADAIAS